MVLLKRSRKRYGPHMQWTDKDRILLIETVIQVEKENGKIMHNSSMPIKPSTGRTMGKWGRINYLLRRKTQEKGMLTPDRCMSMFANILRMYRAHLRGKSFGSSGRILTKPVLQMLRKREHLLNATPISVEPESPSSSSSLHTHINRGQSSEGQSMGTSTKQAASRFSLDHANESSKKSRETQSRGGSRSVRLTDKSKGVLNKSKEGHNDLEDSGESSVRPGAQTRGQTSRNPPLGDGSCMRRSTTSRGPTRYEKPLPGVSDGPLRRLDVEFSELSSWLENQLIPSGKKDFKQKTISAIRSSKRPKLSIYPPPQLLDNLLRESQSRTVKLHIQKSFQNLKVRLAQLLKQASVEVAQAFIQDTPFVYTSPDCSHGAKQS